jgi:hypothetical protein
MASHTTAECRTCGGMERCKEWTLHTKDVVIHDEGYSVQDGELLTGQCDECLEDYGADDDCTVPEEQDEAYARAEIEYRDLDKGEL